MVTIYPTGFSICTGWKLFQKLNVTEVEKFLYRFNDFFIFLKK
jgi:hypothetical protein